MLESYSELYWLKSGLRDPVTPALEGRCPRVPAATLYFLI